MFTIIKIGVVLAVFTILSFLIKRPFRRSNIIVILFMIALTYPMIPKLFPMDINYNSIWIFEIFRATPFTFGPFLLFYTKSETDILKEFKISELFHFIPFIAISTIMIIFFTFFSNGFPVKHGLIHNLPPEFTSEYFGGLSPELDLINEFTLPVQYINPEPFVMIFNKITGALIFISFIVYTFLIITVIKKHNKKITDYFSSNSVSVSFKWIKWIILSFFLSYIFVLLMGIYYHGDGPVPELVIVPDLATTFFIFMFGFFSINQPVLYTNGYDDNGCNLIDCKTEKKYEKSGLKPNEAEKYHKMIIDYMISEKPYINPDLTLNHISENLGIPKHHITQVINEKINKNFFMFINEYRINEVKKRIINEPSGESSILRIAFESGFNSKSAFNSTFKKTTGMTPSEYRKVSCNGGQN